MPPAAVSQHPPLLGGLPVRRERRASVFRGSQLTPAALSGKGLVGKGKAAAGAAAAPSELDAACLASFGHNWRGRLPAPVQRGLMLIQRGLHCTPFTLLVVLLTLCDLFLDELKIRFLSKQADWDVQCFIFATFVFFCLELLLNCATLPGYTGFSLFFFLDVVTACSLLPEMPMLWYPIVGLRSTDDDAARGDSAFELDRIVRVSSVGVELQRVMAFVKLLRLGRLAKLIEVSQRKLEEAHLERKREATRAKFGEDALQTSQYAQPSQLGQHLAERTTRKVVLLVLVLLIVLPQLQPVHVDHSQKFSFEQAVSLASLPILLPNLVALRHPTSAYEVIPKRDARNDPAVALAANATLVSFGRDELSTMLAAYSTHQGQPLPTGDKYSFLSPPLNVTHVQSILSDPQLLPVATAALQSAQAKMDAEFRHLLSVHDSTLLYVRIRGRFYSNDYLAGADGGRTVFDLRPSEMAPFSSGGSLAVFDQHAEFQAEAEMSLIRTAAVLVLLTLASIAFNLHNHRMIIMPIERMMSTIVALQANPLAKASLSAIERAESSEKRKDDAKASGAAAVGGGNETGMLERTLGKLTGLLQIGFGAAGSKMIQKAMTLSGDSDLNPLVDGTRMLAIFGFCDIRRFTDATECLREEVMLYVNEIAAIVHTHVTNCDGAPNKNVGDAFLLVWTLPPDQCDADDLFNITEQQPLCAPTFSSANQRAGEPIAMASASSSSSAPHRITPPAGGWVVGQTVARRRQIAAMKSEAERQYALELDEQVAHANLLDRCRKAGASVPPIARAISPSVRLHLSVLGDKALVSFLRIHVDLAASEEVARYAAHPRIQEAFDDFVVSLGFGLHVGWAIEGPIGSRHKIDASYLSPHVNLSETLQDCTKLYGCPVLMSGEFYTLLSPYMQAHCRRLDVIRVAGRDEPVNLYGVDVHPSALRAMLAGDAPSGYDVDADIAVVNVRGRHSGGAEPEVAQPSQTRRSRNVRNSLARAARVDLKQENKAGAADAAGLRALMTNPYLHSLQAAPASSLLPIPIPLSDGAAPFASRLRCGVPPAAAAAAAAAAEARLRRSDSDSSASSSSSPSAAAEPSSSLLRAPAGGGGAASSIGVEPSGSLRTLIAASSPIASYHLVHNYRLSALSAGIPPAFFDCYAAGLESFLQGDWMAADGHFAVAQLLYAEDAASALMRQRCKQANFSPPDNWTGCSSV